MSIDFDKICPNEPRAVIQAAITGGRVDGIIYHRKDFYSPSARQKDTWEIRDLEWVKTELRDRGYSTQIKDQKGLSLLDRAIQYIKNHHSVDYVGTVAGYKAGVHEDEHGEFLVPRGPNLIEPQNIPFPTIDKVLDAVFTKAERKWFERWLKCAVEALRRGPVNRTFQKGQVLVLAGPVNCGKSLLQDRIITPLLGGRAAIPEQFFKSGTTFNGDLVEKEHLKMEDTIPQGDTEKRQELAKRLKQIAANSSHYVNAKHKQAREFNPFWRCTLSINDDPDSLRVLPRLEVSLMDKLTILRLRDRDEFSPLPRSKDQAAFEQAIAEELPGLLYYLLYVLTIPQELTNRMGVVHYHNESILEMIQEASQALELLDWIQLSQMTQGKTWKGQTVQFMAELAMHLDPHIKNLTSVSKFLKNASYTGKLLTELCLTHPDIVKFRRSNGRNLYTIQPAEEWVSIGG
jgi:hypothetical protein